MTDADADADTGTGTTVIRLLVRQVARWEANLARSVHGSLAPEERGKGQKGTFSGFHVIQPLDDEREEKSKRGQGICRIQERGDVLGPYCSYLMFFFLSIFHFPFQTVCLFVVQQYRPRPFKKISCSCLVVVACRVHVGVVKKRLAPGFEGTRDGKLL